MDKIENQRVRKQ